MIAGIIFASFGLVAIGFFLGCHMTDIVCRNAIAEIDNGISMLEKELENER